MAASKRSKNIARIAREERAAQSTAFARDRDNDEARDPDLAARYTHYRGQRGYRSVVLPSGAVEYEYVKVVSSVDAGDLERRLRAIDKRVGGQGCLDPVRAELDASA